MQDSFDANFLFNFVWFLDNDRWVSVNLTSPVTSSAMGEVRNSTSVIYNNNDEDDDNNNSNNNIMIVIVIILDNNDNCCEYGHSSSETARCLFVEFMLGHNNSQSQ